MGKKMALGKGIASLIKESPNEILRASLEGHHEVDSLDSINKNSDQASNGVSMISIDAIKPNPSQPRKIFKEQELEELAQSIRENGVIQPLLVTKVDKGFELIAGERRLRASKRAGLTQVPVIIKRATDKEKSVFAIIENIQRSDLNCIEEALAYFQLINEFKLTQEELSKKIGKERSTVANFLRLLRLPREVVELLQKEKLSFGHGKILAGLENHDLIKQLANEVAETGMSVRGLEAKINEILNPVIEPIKAKELNENNSVTDELRQRLEKITGLHLKLKMNKRGSGKLSIIISNKAEFERVFEALTAMRKG
jgi:ParB family chromosome partitioning protein